MTPNNRSHFVHNGISRLLCADVKLPAILTHGSVWRENSDEWKTILKYSSLIWLWNAIQHCDWCVCCVTRVCWEALMSTERGTSWSQLELPDTVSTISVCTCFIDCFVVDLVVYSLFCFLMLLLGMMCCLWRTVLSSYDGYRWLRLVDVQLMSPSYLSSSVMKHNRGTKIVKCMISG